jgi:Integrase core domain
VERFHKTMRREFFNRNTFATIDEAQAALDGWVEEYNTERDHQSLGDRPPIERFRLARADHELEFVESAAEPPMDEPLPPAITRRVGGNGCISLACHHYLAARWLAGEVVEVTVDAGLVEISHRGVLVATHARGRPVDAAPAVTQRPQLRRPRPATVGAPVRRLVDSSGSVSFAGTNYRVGNAHKRAWVDVAIVGNQVQFTLDGTVIREHPIRHDRAKEHGVFATPAGRPARRGPPPNPSTHVVQEPEPKRRAGAGT